MLKKFITNFLKIDNEQEVQVEPEKFYINPQIVSR